MKPTGVAVKASLSGNPNGNTTASTMLRSLVAGNAGNLSITEYPGLNESLVSLNQDFAKMRLGEYMSNAYRSGQSKGKKDNGRNISSKKFLRDAHTEIRKKNSGSVTRKKGEKKNTGSKKRIEEGKSRKKKGERDSMTIVRSSCSNTGNGKEIWTNCNNFPKIEKDGGIQKEKRTNRNIIAQNKIDKGRW